MMISLLPLACKTTDGKRRRIAATIGLASIALAFPMTIKAAPPKPELPATLAFRLEDGRHNTIGLTLSFALPGALNYECHRIAFREDRRDREIAITLLGVEPAENYENCRMAKVPAPIQQRIVLPPELGNYRIVFADGSRRDTYTLSVTQDAVALDAEGEPTITRCDQTGKLLRVAPHWLWVDLSFLTDESLHKMSAKRDELLGALAAMGAKSFTPPPGRYLLDGFVRQIPGSPRSDGEVKEEHYFLWDGDWEELRKLANRYRRYASVSRTRPVMVLWLSSRDNVVSTAGGYLNTHIQRNGPSAEQQR